MEVESMLQGGSVVKLQSYFNRWNLLTLPENFADSNFNGSGEGGTA